MSAVSEMSPGLQSRERPPSDAPSGASVEAVRWVTCFVIAAALHGVIAYYLVERIYETDKDSGIDTPVVMLDLPEALAPSIAPPLDLPPGPMQPDLVETPPPPKEEETKPPEPMEEVVPPRPEPPKLDPEQSEVVLPKAEPPKPEPEPPPPAPTPTAPQAARTPPSSVVRWQSQLSAHIERFMHYPAAARTHGDVGTAMVAFTIDREGHLLRSNLAQSSGSAVLDQEALAILARAQPMPRPAPDQLTNGELTVVVPMRFKLR